MHILENLFYPKSVALIGASSSEEKLGGVVLRNLLGLKGVVFPVNPNSREIMGMKTYPSILDVPESVDLSVIMRPAAEVPDLLRLHAGKAKFVLIVSAGFAETGAAALQEELSKIGREAGLRLVGPNCLGIYNPFSGLDTLFLPRNVLKRPGRGNVAVVSQSGAIMVCLLEALRVAGTGVSKVFNNGNAIDIDAPDVYEYLAEDHNTEVVVSYLESVGDGRRFIAAARRLSDKKPLLVLKAGKGTSGQAAAFSHTGRLAGKYEVFRSILKQFGIKEIRDYDDLLDAAKALSFQRQGQGRRVCVITNGGGSGVLATDECMRQGLEVKQLPEKVAAFLSSSFPPFYITRNPMDLTGQVRADDYRVALNAVRDDFDGFLVIALTGVAGVTLEVADILHNFKEKTGKPVTVHIAQGGIATKLVRRLEKSKIPVYPSPERAVRSLAVLLAESG
jgi:acyl-CoA synthetase (NDP forming)